MAGHGLAKAERNKTGPKGRGAATDPEAVYGSDQKGKLAALNQSGAFLHIAAIHAARSSGCRIKTELPVRVAPFVSDPMAQEGAASRRIGPDGPLLRNRTRMAAAIAKSQDGLQGKQRTIDIVATKSIGGKHYVFVMEVKRRDSHYVDWVFIDQDLGPTDYFATAVSTAANEDALPLMQISKYSIDGKDLYVRKERLGAIDSIVPACADYGLVITPNKQSKEPPYKFQDDTLYKATGQVLEGAYGMIVDTVTNRAANADLREHSTVYYIPVIVTNANLRICRYSLKDLTDDLSGMKRVELEQCSSLVYHCPHPVVARFPHQITSVERPAQATMATKWPVIVANIGDLGRILDGSWAGASAS